MFKNKIGFHRVLLIRPENCLEQFGRPHEDEPILMAEACLQSNGTSIIGAGHHNISHRLEIGEQVTNVPFGHTPYDHAWLLCQGSRAHVFREALGAFGLDCEKPCRRWSQPWCPKHFCKLKLSCGSDICETARILQKKGLPFGTLDSYIVSN
mmetsp:Transcript_15167/g.34427  ORF Transcript_15167/g.34427 Transcript_15167/m.34427 type:complete len:152 (+) Transcript_15167:73-528(+)